MYYIQKGDPIVTINEIGRSKQECQRRELCLEATWHLFNNKSSRNNWHMYSEIFGFLEGRTITISAVCEDLSD